MKNKLQLISITILNSQYKILFTIFLSSFLYFLFSPELIVFCSLEEKEEYIRFLENEAWILDSRITELEKRVSELEHYVNDLKQAVAEQKTVIETQQQQLLAQTQAKSAETKI